MGIKRGMSELCSPTPNHPGSSLVQKLGLESIVSVGLAPINTGSFVWVVGVVFEPVIPSRETRGRALDDA